MAHGMRYPCTGKLQVLGSPEELAAAAVEKWMELTLHASRSGGRFTAALSGGKTPVTFYTKLAGTDYAPFRELTHFFMVDERYVPEAHGDSTYRMLQETLFFRLCPPALNLHRIATDFHDPEEAAVAYESHLKGFFSLAHGQFPRFDLIVLGMGGDGHTASLFPGDDVLKERERLVIHTASDSARHHRVTLTLPVLNNSRHVLFLVSGRQKAPVLRKIVEEKDSTLPASLVRPGRGELLFLADRDAASELSL